MGWLVSFATAAFVWTVGADVHTFTGVPQMKGGATNLKTVYVNGPALVKVEVSSTLSIGSSPSEGHPVIVICPFNCNASRIISCDPQNKPTIMEKVQNIHVLEISSPGPVWSHQEVLPETGAYDVILASCAETAKGLTITISGSLGAHEGGWGMHYACIAVLYAVLGLVWLRIRGGLDATRASLKSDISFASFMLLGMACAGFVMHALPQKNILMNMLLVGWICAAIATLMTTLLQMTAVGFETSTATNWYFEIAWYIFALCHFIALPIHETFDGFMFNFWSGHTFTSENANYVLFPLIAGYAVFGVSCLICLRRSATSGKAELSFVSQVAAVVVIYTVLSIMSAFCRAYDVPSADPETWKSHYVSEIVGQLTQAFGLAAALYVIQHGVPMHEPAKGDGGKQAYGQIDEEIPLDNDDDDQTAEQLDKDDDDQTAEQQSCISPVVYGVG